MDGGNGCYCLEDVFLVISFRTVWRGAKPHGWAAPAELSYDPALVHAPVAIIRGEWDGMSTEEDAKWLFNALKSSPIRRIVTISRGTHLMHLEESRYALYRETEAFLAGNDTVAARERQAT